MAARSFPKFPLDVLAGIGLGLAVSGAALFLTLSPVGADFRLWWQARSWPPAQCRVIRPVMQPDGFLYGYESGGQRYHSSRMGIGDKTELRESLKAARANAPLNCWVDPQNPAQALLDKRYHGWWWLPGAWALGAVLTLAALRGLGDLWRWFSFKADPPLSWSEWLRSFYQGNAWGATLIGLCGLVPGLLAVKVLTVESPWNWARAQHWEATPCVVVEGKIRWHSSGRFPSRSWQGMDLAFEYYRGGKRYVGSTYSPWHWGDTDWIVGPPREMKDGKVIEMTKALVLGTRHTCYVRPDRPEEAFLSRDWWDGEYLIAAIGPALCLLGLIAICARPRY